MKNYALKHRLRRGGLLREKILVRPNRPLPASSNKLLSSNFTLENFSDVFAMREFEAILLVTFAYTVLGTLGAIVVGLFAAQLLNLSFPGRMIFRGLFLFPYVAPVIAMAFTWLVLLDPNSGALNALLLQMGAIETPINFFGIRWTEVELFGLNLPVPLALLMVIAFEIWRYFPLSFSLHPGQDAICPARYV